jgi:hypothetical protein
VITDETVAPVVVEEVGEPEIVIVDTPVAYASTTPSAISIDEVETWIA